jgi:hypothetical protein
MGGGKFGVVGVDGATALRNRATDTALAIAMVFVHALEVVAHYDERFSAFATPRFR